MIPEAYVAAWRSRAPWSTDVQVEQDLVISRAIIDIFSDDRLVSQVAFRGGTAIHKLLFDTPGRYSEDIDLVKVEEGPIGTMMDALRERLQPWLGKPRWKQRAERVTLIFKFESESEPVVPMRLKVEINTREQFTVLGHARRKFEIDTLWHTGSAEVLTYVPEELLGTKMRALYQRKKGRDLFDLAEVSKRLPGLDAAEVVDCFQGYMKHCGHRVSRAEFEANLAAKLKDKTFTDDVLPLLADGVSYDHARAYRDIQAAFVSRLPGDPWKGGS